MPVKKLKAPTKGRRPKTGVKASKPKHIEELPRPTSAPTAEEAAQFLQLKTEIFGFSLYQQISPERKLRKKI